MPAQVLSLRPALQASEGPVERLLERLSSQGVDAAWREFLERFSPLIMHVVRRYESDHGQVMDCFLHACGELSDNGFKRLHRYRPEGSARFGTWLTAVVSNLCVDWRRKQHGRFRSVQSVARLPELDQLIYQHIYVRGMPRDECLHALEARFPGLTEQKLSEINARLFSLLTPEQRYRLSMRAADPIRLDESWLPDPDQPDQQIPQVEEPGPGPEELAQTEQDRLKVAAAMARLPPKQRLLLRLRYEQNLTLAEIARLTRLPDPFHANRQIQGALVALEELLK